MIKTKSMRIRLTEEEWSGADSASIALFGRPNKSRLMRKLLRDYIGMGPDLTDEEMSWSTCSRSLLFFVFMFRKKRRAPKLPIVRHT